VLTVVATIFVPPTFVAGIYGMNVADGPYDTPELGRTFGHPAAMLGTTPTGVVILLPFRRREYLQGQRDQQYAHERRPPAAGVWR